MTVEMFDYVDHILGLQEAGECNHLPFSSFLTRGLCQCSGH